jgi:alanine-glyoxylate transaminase / serine-glyoxylate transaminase / serine-pyruvate transaminase
MMLPPGLGFSALSIKAIEANKTAKSPKAFLAWDDILESNKTGYWPTTPSINLLYGLHEAIEMLITEGLENVFARHQRLASACRAAVAAWGLDVQCLDADALRKLILERYNLSLGTGLGKVKGRLFRIGHMGDCNALTLLTALSGCEMGMKAFGIKLKGSGVLAAHELLR